MAIRFINEPNIRRRPSGSFNLKYLKEAPALVLLIYFTAFFGFLFFYITPMEIPFILNSKTSVSTTMVGISLSISILMGSIVAFQYARIRKLISYRDIYAISFFLMAMGYAVISFAEVYAVFLTGLILQGLGTGLLMPNSNLWLVNIAPAGIRGRMIGNLSFFVYMGQFLSPVFFNPIAAVAGPQGGFGILGIFMLIIAALFLFSKTKKSA
ncbi:MAG: MFS transporter [Bacteroidota bacterium]|nr:MFS transporter [Bacteroidota bacterium]